MKILYICTHNRCRSILCGSQDGLQRQQVKQLLDGWEKNSPGRRNKMFRALMNIRPSHMLDPELFDFAGLMRHFEPGTSRRLSCVPSPLASTTG